MARHRTRHTLKEGPAVLRTFGLLSGCSLLMASVWLVTQIRAQEAPPRNPFAEEPPSSSAGTAGVAPYTRSAPPMPEEPNVARLRINDAMRQAQLAFEAGDLAEALRQARRAEQIARQWQVTFHNPQESPTAFIARLEGRSASGSLAAGSGDQPQSELKAQALQLIAQAQSALEQGDLATAQAKAQQAAELNVTFTPFEPQPHHILAEVSRRQQASPSGPSQEFSPSWVRSGQSAAPQSTPAANPFAPPKTPEEEARELVRLARTAMEAGDYSQARSLALQAQALNFPFELLEDRPEAILRELSQRTGASFYSPSGQNLTSTAESSWSDPRLDQARQLLSESRQHLQSGRFVEAQHFAERAQALNAPFSISEDRPELVLQDIRQAQSRQTAGSPFGDWAAPRTSGAPTEQQAQDLLAQARQAMQIGNYVEAESYLSQAEQLNVTFSLLGDRPDLVRADLERLTRGGSQPPAHPFAGQGLSVEERKRTASELLARAQAAMEGGDLDTARNLAEQAKQFEVTYGLLETHPDVLLTQIQALQSSGSPSLARQPSAGPLDVTSSPSAEYFAPGVSAQPRPDRMVVQSDGRSALELYNHGTQLLREGNLEMAYQTFLAAYHTGERLDPYRQQRMNELLQQLAPRSEVRTASNEVVQPGLRFGEPSPLDSEVTRQSLIFDRLRTETMNTIFHAERQRDNNPEASLRMLEQQLAAIQNSELTEQQAAPLIRQVNSARSSMEAYVAQRAPLLEMRRNNEEVRAEVERTIANRVRQEQELAKMVDEYNSLMEERRFHEAHLVATRAKELDPNNPVTVQMYLTSLFQIRVDNNDRLQDSKERMFWESLNDVEWAAARDIPSDANPLLFARDWTDIVSGRRPSPVDGLERSEAEERVRQSLNSSVSLHFDNAPLSQVMESLSHRFGINVWVDDPALTEIGLTPSHPISIHVDDIKLKSALTLILRPLDLSYVIDQEVLVITSRLRQQGEMSVVTYGVADLVVPITTRASNPNVWMMPGTGYGMQNNGFQFGGGQFNSPVAGGMQQIPVDPLSPLAGLGGGAPQNPKLPGGATQADFDALMDLITTTVGPGTWSEVGGQGSIDRHPSTLSLIIRQTGAVHQEIRDLLEQLRRLQDLQVTIEVRFITVSDQFFEQVGIDFDFNIQDTVGGPRVDDNFNPISPFGSTDPVNGVFGGQQQGQGGQAGQQQQAGGQLGPTAPFGPQPTLNIVGRDNWPRRTVVGMAAPQTFSGDLDIPFRQGSFDFGVPPFGGFQETAGLTFGMAILSDLEAFLFVRAAQGDRRSNIMFAPKITLFNGQAGSLFSGTVRPFVIALIPVASAFAIGFQPIIQQVPEGVSMSVAAVVSADRRYVRLAVFPQFTNITDVFTFSFIGGVGGGIGGGGGFGGGGGGFGGGGFGGGGGGFGGGQQGQQGQGGSAGTVTLQQPVVDIVTIDTVVSVPDGGTVLLGGVKRLSEGRNMAGVPILNKIPYVSRLFKNTGVGRETQSLMLMVTPRIIIQEELEEALFGPDR